MPGKCVPGETRMLRIGLYQEKDCAVIAKWVKDERSHALWCANLLPYPFDEASFEKVRMEMEKTWGSSSFVVSADDGELIGYFCININSHENSAFLSFIIVNDEMRGQGYGTEMLQLIKEHVFSRGQAEKIELRVFDVNEAAVRCYRKAGFKVVQREPEAFSFREEKWGRLTMEAYRGI